MRIGRGLAGLLLLAAGAVAEPPAIEDLKGCWWDEDGSLMVEIGEGGRGSLMDGASQKSQSGRFSMSAEGKLVFAAPGTPATEWTASMAAGRLVLTGANGLRRSLYGESRAERELRLAHEVERLLDVRHELETADPAAAEDLKRRERDLSASAAAMRLSLAGADLGAQLELVGRLLAKHAPDAAKEFAAAARAERAGACEEHLRSLLWAALDWEREKRAWPGSAAEVKTAGRLNGALDLKCPLGGREDAYVLAVPRDAAGDAVVAYDHDAHPDGLRFAVTRDATVAWMTEAELQRALAEGAKAVIPRFTISSATAGTAVSVEGAVAGLRAAGKAGKKSVAASIRLVCRFQEKGALKSAPQHVEAAESDQPLPVSVKLDFSPRPAPEGASFYVEILDEVRGDRFDVPVALRK